MEEVVGIHEGFKLMDINNKDKILDGDLHIIMEALTINVHNGGVWQDQACLGKLDQGFCSYSDELHCVECVASPPSDQKLDSSFLSSSSHPWSNASHTAFLAF
ncbi:hypothetical protein C1H46_001508 [Malus baccata]|uniref:Uncharacterized protein n=1 Tax=Malus baccata TaxID=106549 RepID=A0A540NPA4_MALBA|nr:hypothetical protein C1H46_001508 [Malus baccata]